MARKRIDDIERQIQRGQRHEFRQKQAAGESVICAVCGKPRRNCKEVRTEYMGLQLICGQCRYEHAMSKQADEAESARDFMVTIMLNRLANEGPLEVGLVFVQAKLSLPAWAKAREVRGEVYTDCRDRLWQAMYDLKLFGEGAERYAPRGEVR